MERRKTTPNNGDLAFLESIKRGLTVDQLRDSLFNLNGGNWKERDENGTTALHLAVKMGKADVVKFLIIELLADVNIEDKNGRTPLEYALSTTTDPEECLDALFYLLALGANPVRETNVSNFDNLVMRYEGLEDGKLKTILKHAGISCSKSPVVYVKHRVVAQPLKRTSPRFEGNSEPKILKRDLRKNCRKSLIVKV